MDTTANHTRIRLKDDLLITSLDDSEGIVLDVDSKSYYLINETGLFLLNVLQQNDGQVDYSTLKDRLLREYNVPEEDAERDIADFLRGLTDRSLVSLSRA